MLAREVSANRAALVGDSPIGGGRITVCDNPGMLITDAGELARHCGRLASEPYIAVDTEFMRERTYRAELCLIQI